MLSIQRRMLFVAYTHGHTRAAALLMRVRAAHTQQEIRTGIGSRLCGIKNLVKITKR